MNHSGKKLGILLSAAPDHPNFGRCLKLAEAALEQNIAVYLYCLDDAVCGIANTHLQSLKKLGLRLFGCAYGARNRGVPLDEQAIYCGLGTLQDLMKRTDRFLAFSGSTSHELSYPHH